MVTFGVEFFTLAAICSGTRDRARSLLEKPMPHIPTSGPARAMLGALVLFSALFACSPQVTPATPTTPAAGSRGTAWAGQTVLTAAVA